MNWMTNLVVMLQIVTALVMIGLVLVQHGKGADMGASFGSGASGSLFGATGSANFLSRSTAVCAAIFFACTLLLAYISNERMMRPSAGSVLEQPAAAAASAPPATGAAQIPGSSEVPPPAAVAPAAVPEPVPAAASASASAPGN